MPPDEFVRIWHVDLLPYVVDVEIQRDVAGQPIATGFAVRRAYPLKSRRDFGRDPQWPEGTEPEPIVPRVAQRASLTTLVDAAVRLLQQLREEGSSRMLPVQLALSGGYPKAPKPGRPAKGESNDFFYRLVAHTFNLLKEEGVKAPAPALARLLGGAGANANQANQWIWRAREKGFLPESPRTQRKRAAA